MSLYRENKKVVYLQSYIKILLIVNVPVRGFQNKNMATKPAIPKGTRDFSPEEMAKRNYIFDTISEVFHLFGFQQIKTPAMENLSTLMGKYGEEGDKLLFKVLNSGDFLSGVTDEELSARNTNKLASMLCEKGLRYDLTVPFARFVVMHRNEIGFTLLRGIRYNRFGAPTDRKKAVIVNFISVMPMLSGLIRC